MFFSYFNVLCDSTIKNFPDSGIHIPLQKATMTSFVRLYATYARGKNDEKCYPLMILSFSLLGNNTIVVLCVM